MKTPRLAHVRWVGALLALLWVVLARRAHTPGMPALLASAEPLPKQPGTEPVRGEAELEWLRPVLPGGTLSCAQFHGLGLAASLAKHRGDPAWANLQCGDKAARIVTCVETPGGCFVPVVQPDGCNYRLWFVPRDVSRPVLPVSEVLQEFDLDFTVRIAADDLDDDGEVEALLIRGWEHPEGVGDGVQIFLIEPKGGERQLPFDDFRDVDGDGRDDAIVSFDTTVNAAGCEPPDQFEAWVARSISPPWVLLHRVAGSKFSMTDAVSRAKRAESCQKLGADVVARDSGGVDEEETLRRAICRLADGEDPDAIGRALAAACPREYEIPADCKRRRPGVCFWRSTLLGVAERFTELKPWLVP